MEIKIFTIYDEKAEAYLQPFFSNTVGLAIRSVTDLVNDPEHHFCNHASEFTLFEIGAFDNNNAVIAPDKKYLGSLVEFKTNFLTVED